MEGVNKILLALTVALLASTSLLAQCRYQLGSTDVYQCQPIKQIDGAWTYVKEASGPGIMAHVFCACHTALTQPTPGCDISQKRQLTFTQATKNVAAFCGRQDICDAPCEKLLQRAPVLQ